MRIEISNAKRFLTTYSLWFDMVAKLSKLKGRLPLARRLNPERNVSLEWSFIPVTDGRISAEDIAGFDALTPPVKARVGLADAYHSEILQLVEILKNIDFLDFFA